MRFCFGYFIHFVKLNLTILDHTAWYLLHYLPGFLCLPSVSVLLQHQGATSLGLYHPPQVTEQRQESFLFSVPAVLLAKLLLHLKLSHLYQWVLTETQQDRRSCTLEMMSTQPQTSFLKHKLTNSKQKACSRSQNNTIGEWLCCHWTNLGANIVSPYMIDLKTLPTFSVSIF